MHGVVLITTLTLLDAAAVTTFALLDPAVRATITGSVGFGVRVRRCA